jgi:hypothetical protein
MRDAAKLYARGAIDLGTLEEIKRDIDVQLDKVNEAAATQPTELAGLPGTVAEVRERWAASASTGSVPSSPSCWSSRSCQRRRAAASTRRRFGSSRASSTGR